MPYAIQKYKVFAYNKTILLSFRVVTYLDLWSTWALSALNNNMC